LLLITFFSLFKSSRKVEEKAEILNTNTIATLKKKARFALNCEDSLTATVLKTETEYYAEQGVKLGGGIKAYKEIGARTIGIECCNGKII
jgi:hypothetical protein